MPSLYDADFYTWAMSQGSALRRRSANEIDWENVAEEIETLGRSEARELLSRYAVLLAHLLKWMIQPQARSTSWEISIKRQRRDIARLLVESPGLKPRRDELFGEAFQDARDDAVLETGLSLDRFPDTNPFTLAQTMDDGFWPEGPSPT